LKKLVIVESPHKCKPIGAYLGSEYKVVSSKGHIRDLATTGKFGLGVDVENEFEPNYVPIKGKKQVITELKKDVKNASFVYLATDPDREGEAISWHLKEALEIKEENYERVTFNEITKNVVQNAFNETRKIDDNLVKSQETRRILDRIIGFRLSKLMQAKTGGKSAGRVQSVALKLIVDREREIEAFKPEEYWTIEADFKEFVATLEKYRGKKIEIHGEKEADDILSQLSKSFRIESVDSKDTKKASKPAFITSTLQRMAATSINFAPSKTMRIAQKLYEGVELEHETVGLITYMRTDSERLSPEFVTDTMNYIKNKYGEQYVGSVKIPKGKKNMQDAHEAIRPTSILRTPDSIKAYISNEEYKLYKLIYDRTLASLMASATSLSTTVILENNGYTFKTTGSILKFDGYLKIYSPYEETKDVILPNFANYKSEVIIANDILKYQHFTKPLPRFSESSLIKELESLGIGRPSTYATIVQTIKERGYVILEDKKFQPTEIGRETTDKLQEFFSDIVNVKYTANMESDLDEIAEDKMESLQVLQEFYDQFEPLVEKAFQQMEKKEAEKTGEICPECGSDLVIRKGKYGEFVACSNYPNCKYIKKEEIEKKSIIDCPKCGKEIIEKRTRKGKIFYGCTGYPNCDFATWYKPTNEKCTNCGNILVEKKDGLECLECKNKNEAK
jgi:DNA topoisomerase-1